MMFKAYSGVGAIPKIDGRSILDKGEGRICLALTILSAVSLPAFLPNPQV
jgi:hypothetical protein